MPNHRACAEVEKVKKIMPVGISDFKKLIEMNGYFVDKSSLIKEILDNQPEVILFARPRRFGKTIAMSMVKYYFDRENAAEHKHLFQDLAIMQAGEGYQQEQGKYPVIFLSLKDVKKTTWKETLGLFNHFISEEFDRVAYLLDSDKLTPREKKYMQKVIDGAATQAELEVSLASLTKFLAKHHGVKPILLIDEYDMPIQAGYIHGYYDEIIDFTRIWFSGALKDNVNLKFALLTGILRVAKESIFSGLNNLEVSTMLSEGYNQYFGFTEEEVRLMAKDYGREDILPEIKRWYDGYDFGGKEIYNPWSLINYFKNNCRAEAYWLHTSSNDIIHQLLKKADNLIKRKLQMLLNNESIESSIESNIVYADVEKNKIAIFSFLLMTGYLKIAGTKRLYDGQLRYLLKIPNLEIYRVYKTEIIEQMVQGLERDYLSNLLEDIVDGKAERFADRLERILCQTASYYDTQENFYHGFLLGITAIMASAYQIASNRESGYGRFDLAFFPKEESLAGILMEIKVAGGEDQLAEKAEEALQQIKEKAYLTEFQTRGCMRIHQYGIAFCGKKVCIVKAEE